MSDEDKTKEQLINELVALRQRVVELKASETERKRAEELYRTLVSRAPTGVYIAQEGKLVFVNPQFQKYIGFTLDELLGRDPWELVHPDDRVQVRENAVAMLKGKRSAPYEFRTFTKSGETIWSAGTIAPVYYKGKRAALGNFVDITDRKRMEERLRELYEEEKELRQELEAEMERRMEFTRVLVHELKTPLTPVLASSELLVAQLQEEPLLTLARNINRGASNLNNRIDELLDLARGEMGMLQLKSELVDLLQLLHGMVDDMALVASSQGQSLLLELPPSLPLVWADESRLRQVVLNLLSNALKFTPEGGKITLRAKRKDSALIVEVQDTGPGIAEADQQRLFEPYHRLESDQEHLSGLGLGLALCKTLVELHGGHIWVESRVGEGSTFSFSVPLRAIGRRAKGSESGGKV